MNLKKLFEMQKVLRDRIDYNEPDRFNKLILALLVELGECANEWRGFKFWSKDQKPRTKTYKSKQAPGGEFYRGIYEANPLLEEYVDGLHFVLDLGVEIKIPYQKWIYRGRLRNNVVDKFTDVYEAVIEFANEEEHSDWVSLYEHYLGLGEMLGFTWEQIEQAYITKNEINHQRQDNGY